MLKSIVAITVVIASFVAFAVRAAEPAPEPTTVDPATLFRELDKNQDGQITADEIAEDKRRLFERLLRTSDKNGDGKLTSEEFAAGLKGRERTNPQAAPQAAPAATPEGGPAPEKIFARLDANGDGKLTFDEVPEPRRELFSRLFARGDKDGDKALSRAEFIDAMQNAKRPQQIAKFAKPAPADRPVERIFRRLDKNADGKITLDEIPEERRSSFERVIERSDKNGDKALTLEEFAAGNAKAATGAPEAKPAGFTTGAAEGGPPLAGLFRILDTNHDGQLDSAEISAAADVLRKLDKNGDGTLSPQEVFSQGRTGDTAK